MRISRKKVAILISAVLGVLWVSWAHWQNKTADQAVGVQLVCLTNVPGVGTRALFNITNRTDALIGVRGYGHVAPGESVTLPFPIPPGTGPWRVAVEWQGLDLGWFDVSMNRTRRRVEEALGAPRHVNAWFPPMRVSHSAEIRR